MQTAIDLLRLAAALSLFLAGLYLISESMRPAAFRRIGQLFDWLHGTGGKPLLAGVLASFQQLSSVRGAILVTALAQCTEIKPRSIVLALAGTGLGAVPIVLFPVVVSWLPQGPVMAACVAMGTAGMLMLMKDRTNPLAFAILGFGAASLGTLLGLLQIAGCSITPGLSRVFAIIGAFPLFSLLTGFAIGALLQSAAGAAVLLQMGAVSGILSLRAGVLLVAGIMLGSLVPVLQRAMSETRTARVCAMVRTFCVLSGTVPVCLVSLFLPGKATVFSMAAAFCAMGLLGSLVVYGLSGWLAANLGFEPEGETLYGALRPFPACCLYLSNQCLGQLRTRLSNLTNGVTTCLLDHAGFEQAQAEEARCAGILVRLEALCHTAGQAPLILAEQTQLKYDILALENFRQIENSCMKIRKLAFEMVDCNLDPSSVKDIHTLAGQCTAILRHALDNREQAEKNREKMEIMTSLMRQGHLKRLLDGRTLPEREFIFLQAVHQYEEIASHARDVAGAGKEIELWKQS